MGSEARIVVVGTSFRQVGFERLARIARPVETAAELCALRDACGADEVVHLATCNRVEVYLSLGERAAPDVVRTVAGFLGRAGDAESEIAELFHVKRGREALDHLFAVTASLTSLAIGETEIAGQARRAVERAAEAGVAGPILARAFERAARAARRVRAETGIGRLPTSVASLCARSVREHFAGEAPRHAVLVGVGDMTRKIGQALAERGTDVLFVNRTLARAEELARKVGGRAMSLEAFRAEPPGRMDVLISATAAPTTVIDARMLAPALAARRQAGERRALLVCDLAMPPDVDPRVAGETDVRLVTLADLEAVARENRERLEGEVARAEVIVADEVDRFLGTERARDLTPTLLEVRAHGRAVAEETVEDLIRRAFRGAGDTEKAALRDFAIRLADRVLHVPLERLRRFAEAPRSS